MESCLFCLRNSLQKMEFSQRSRKQELQTIITLFSQVLGNKQLEMNTTVLSEILEFCQSVIENNDQTTVISHIQFKRYRACKSCQL